MKMEVIESVAPVDVLIATIQELSLARSMESIIQIIKNSARKIIKADGVTFVLRDKELCYYVEEDAISPLWKGKKFSMDTCISGWVMLNRKSAVIEDIYLDDRIPSDAYRPTFVKSLAMFPIRSNNPLGAIGIYWAYNYIATQEEIKFIQALADSTAIAIENINSLSLLNETIQELAIQNNENEKRATELKIANARIMENEEHFRTIAEYTPDHIIIQDNNLRYTFVVNPQLGLTKEDMIGKTDFDITNKYDAEKLNELKLKVLDTGKPLNVEVSLSSVKGGLEYFHGTYSPKIDSSGKINGLIGYFRNITEFKKAENALKESEANLEEAQLIANLGSWEWNFITQKHTWSKNQYRIWGLQPFCIEPSFDFLKNHLFPDDLCIFNENYDDIIQNKKPSEIDFRLILPDGSIKWFHNITIPICEDDKIIMLKGVTIDITQRKSLESKNFNQALQLEQIHNGVITIDLNNKILSWNKYAETLYQWTREEVLGRDIIELLSPEEIISVVKNNFENLHREGHWEGDFDVKRKDNTTIPVHIINTYLKDIMGNNIGFIGISTDITERKKAEQKLEKNMQELEKLNHTKDKFLSIIAHDLRNPFIGINGVSDIMETILLEEKKESMNQLLEFIRMIRSSSKSAINLIENLMQWAKSQTGNMNINLQNFPLHYLVSNIIPIVQGNALRKKILIKKELTDNCTVNADIEMTSTILRNLLTNAIKFTHQNGQITVSSIKKDYFLEISISDTGVGIEPDCLDKIFKIDSKFTCIGTNNEKGTGLGLILCKEFVEKQGGTIWVESELGKGSKFTFTLPLGQ